MSTGAVRRVALYGYLGSGNLGNDASLETVLAWLRAARPSPELLCVTIAPEAVEDRYGVPSTALSAQLPALGPGRAGAVASRLLGRLLDVPRSLVLAGRADAVVVPGMGVLEDTLGTRPWGLPAWLVLMAAACRLRRRPFVLLDVGANRAENPLTRGLYLAAARLAAHVSYRDDASAAAMSAARARGPGTVAPDLAFAHPSPARPAPEPGLVVVGVLAWHGLDHDPVRGAAVRRRYVVTLAAAVVQLVRAGGHRVVLVGGDTVDGDVAEEVRAAARATDPTLPEDSVVVHATTTFTELGEELGRAEVVVASRFHNLIGALRLARPCVSVGYAGKSRELMRAVGLEGYCQDIDALDADLLVAQVASALQEADALTARIRGVVAGYSAEVDALLRRVGREQLGLESARPAVPQPTSESGVRV